jgi:hypothetical protein
MASASRAPGKKENSEKRERSRLGVQGWVIGGRAEAGDSEIVNAGLQNGKSLIFFSHAKFHKM